MSDEKADGEVRLFFEEIAPGDAAAAAGDEAGAAGEGGTDAGAAGGEERLETRATLTFRWQPLQLAGDAPAARGGHTLTLLPGTERMVLFGGADRTGRAFADVHELDTARRRWTRRECSGEGPAGRSGHVAVASPDGARLYVHGGMGAGAEQFLGDVWELNCADWRWRRLSAGGLRRNGHSAVLVGRSTLVVFGGSDRVPQPTVHAFHVDRHEWRRLETVGDPGPPREMHAAAVLPSDGARTAVCVSGGRTEDGVSDGLVCLVVPHAVDAADDAAVATAPPCEWRAAGSGPALCGHAAAAVGNCVAVFGGTDGASFSGSTLMSVRAPCGAGGGRLGGDDWRETSEPAPAPRGRRARRKGAGRKARASAPPCARFAHTLTAKGGGESSGRFAYVLFGGVHPAEDLADAHELRVQPGMVAEAK